MGWLAVEGKRVVVTGGGTGIGLAIAKAFVEAGASVIIVGRREDVLKEASASLGEKCGYHVFDVGNSAGAAAAVGTMETKFGPIDVLVNNAGVNMKKPALEVTDDEFLQVQQANLLGLFAITREVVKGMAARGKGSVLNITSMTALYGLPKVPAYSASKTAVLGLTRALAVEFAPMGVRVNAIAPGFIYSAMTAKALDSDPDRKARVFARTPMGRMGQPEEVASAAVYLCSDAASFITGVNLAVDGGNSIGF